MFEELHRLARRYMKRDRPSYGLEATPLANETRLMRRILVEHTRRHDMNREAGAGLFRWAQGVAGHGDAESEHRHNLTVSRIPRRQRR